ncbi:glycoside hydrolase family 88 protein [Paenibacillus sp. TRM 82003]|nr:glycoside hydrolase family 88 protein [Paenibacillus sp. TRM 82003]
MRRLQLEALLEKAFERMVGANEENSNTHMDFETWEWPVGVAMYGLFKYYRATGNDRYAALMSDWYDRHIREGLPPKNVNSVAPLLTLIHLYEESRNETHLAVCEEWAQWVLHEMPRTQEGGLQHITIIADNKEQLWDDTLFMTVLFLAKMAKVTGNEAYREEAEYQFLLHIKYLADPKTGLWYHGWSFDGRHAFGNNLWARGNCWYTAGAVEFLDISGVGGAVRRFVVEALKAQAEPLLRLQASNGMWHTLLDDPTSYVETSATAGFAYGLLKGVRMGVLEDAYAETGRKAAEAVLQRIAEDGTVTEVSYGTAIAEDPEHYRTIPITPTAYGQSLAIMLLTELLEQTK